MNDNDFVYRISQIQKSGMTTFVTFTSTQFSMKLAFNLLNFPTTAEKMID